MSDHRAGERFDLQQTRRTLPIALLRAREAVMEHFRPMLSAHDVTEQQWRVLRVLHESGELDAKTLAERACILSPSLTRMLRTLEARDFVTMRKDPYDGRRALLRLTKSAEEFLQQVAPESAAIYAQIQQRIGQDRISALLDEVEHLLEALGGKDKGAGQD